MATTAKGPSADQMASLPRNERVLWSHGVARLGKKASHSHGGHSSARNGWSCDDTKDPSYGKTGVPSKHLKGEHRVEMPHGRRTYVRPS